jgi:dTDP-4-dehydrorhamnose 3,5-epimerase
MKFKPTTLKDAMLIDVDRHVDDRGHFGRILCVDEFAAQGLETEFVQANLSRNLVRGTLRGLHRQLPPHEEAKLVRCVRGAMVDVIVDLRPHSPTYRRWEAFELTERNMAAIYVPRGFLHGLMTLEDDTEVLYMLTGRYAPGAEAGIRWNDPTLAIRWPMEPVVMSAKDTAWPLLDP